MDNDDLTPGSARWALGWLIAWTVLLASAMGGLAIYVLGRIGR